MGEKLKQLFFYLARSRQVAQQQEQRKDLTYLFFLASEILHSQRLIFNRQDFHSSSMLHGFMTDKNVI